MGLPRAVLSFLGFLCFGLGSPLNTLACYRDGISADICEHARYLIVFPLLNIMLPLTVTNGNVGGWSSLGISMWMLMHLLQKRRPATRCCLARGDDCDRSFLSGGNPVQ